MTTDPRSHDAHQPANDRAVKQWWWLSFVDQAADGGDSVALHLGCAIVLATSLANAVQEAWDHDCNPGGEVTGMPIEAPFGVAPPSWERWPFSDRSAADRLTYRLLDGPEITTAQALLDEARRRLLPPGG